ncbi:MAG: GNAT family N-acetyltransferase [Desulfobacterales bacterium]|nr:GNAT family N-acetyltransferase [Desulfobacterales bacterium]MDP6808963.1 GNAT family N-acetyltransferase [Desulfobacterales bacterium]
MKQKKVEEPVIRYGYSPGAIGRITELHARYYHQHWEFGLFFESKVASELVEFLGRFEENRDGLWTAVANKQIVGAIAIDGIHVDAGKAHLRWFILAPECQNFGTGNRLLGQAIDFCRKAKFDRIYLWTFSGLDAARHLYEKYHFRLVAKQAGSQWGKRVTEQKFEVDL